MVNLFDYLGKTVELTTNEGVVYRGYVCDVVVKAECDYPDDFICIDYPDIVHSVYRSEVKNIKVVDDN